MSRDKEKDIGKSFKDLGMLSNNNTENKDNVVGKAGTPCCPSKNFGYYFYKDYFIDDNGKSIFEKAENEPSKEILKKSNGFLELSFNDNILTFWNKSTFEHKKQFTLKTTYPGLLIGSGYMHETGSEGEFKIGFFFDYTTGLPIIPGSSIKGILRSAFPHRKYIHSLLKGIDNISHDIVGKLEKNIFEGKDGNDKPISIYKRDVFFDAFPVASKNSDENKIFADDFITPHKDPLKNPVPLKFLKIKPSVKFRFLFKLHDVIFLEDGKEINISADCKKELFEKIILDLGVGAKTNVGYGVLQKTS